MEESAELGNLQEIAKSVETETPERQMVKMIAPDLRREFVNNKEQLEQIKLADKENRKLSIKERTIEIEKARMCSVFMGKELPGFVGLTEPQQAKVRDTLIATYLQTTGSHYSTRGGDEHFAGFEIAPNQEAVVAGAVRFFEVTGPQQLQTTLEQLGISRKISSADMADYIWVAVGRDIDRVPLALSRGKIINLAPTEVVGGAVLSLEAANLNAEFKAAGKLPLLIEKANMAEGERVVTVGKKKTEYAVSTIDRTEVRGILDTQQMRKMEEENVLTDEQVNLLADISFDFHINPRKLVNELLSVDQRTKLGKEQIDLDLEAAYARNQLDIYTPEASQQQEMSVGGIDVTGYSQMGADLRELKQTDEPRAQKYEAALRELMGTWHERIIEAFEMAGLDYGESGGDGCQGLGRFKENVNYFQAVAATVEAGNAWGSILEKGETGEMGPDLAEYLAFVRQKFTERNFNTLREKNPGQNEADIQELAERTMEMPWPKGACLLTKVQMSIHPGTNFTPVTIKVPNPLESMKHGQNVGKDFYQRTEISGVSSVWLDQPTAQMLPELKTFLLAKDIHLIKHENLGYFAVKLTG